MSCLSGIPWHVFPSFVHRRVVGGGEILAAGGKGTDARVSGVSVPSKPNAGVIGSARGISKGRSPGPALYVCISTTRSVVCAGRDVRCSVPRSVFVVGIVIVCSR